MFRNVVTVMCALMLAGAGVSAQQKKVEEKTAATAAKVGVRPTEPPAQPFNIRIEVLITDQVGPGDPSKKTISMIVADRRNNSIRSSAQMRVGGSYRPVGINLDAQPVINPKEPTKILLSFGLEYQPKGSGILGSEMLEPGMSSLTQRLALNLESGKPVLVSQSADPTSDRKITVEVTATILK